MTKRILMRPKYRFVTLLIDSNVHLRSCYQLSKAKLIHKTPELNERKRIVRVIKNV